MGLFYRSRDFQLIETINEELIGEFVNTEIDVYKYNLYESEVNLYGEARSKVYYQGLEGSSFNRTRRPIIRHSRISRCRIESSRYL